MLAQTLVVVASLACGAVSAVASGTISRRAGIQGICQHEVKVDGQVIIRTDNDCTCECAIAACQGNELCLASGPFAVSEAWFYENYMMPFSSCTGTKACTKTDAEL